MNVKLITEEILSFPKVRNAACCREYFCNKVITFSNNFILKNVSIFEAICTENC